VRIGVRAGTKRMQGAAYPSSRVARCMPLPGAGGPFGGNLVAVTAGLCRILNLNFREFLFHAVE
jgi:hypothetical protein